MIERPAGDGPPPPKLTRAGDCTAPRPRKIRPAPEITMAPPRFGGGFGCARDSHCAVPNTLSQFFSIQIHAQTPPPLVHHEPTGFQPPRNHSPARSTTWPANYQKTSRTVAWRASRKSSRSTAGERTDVSFITTDALDRDTQVVLPAGRRLVFVQPRGDVRASVRSVARGDRTGGFARAGQGFDRQRRITRRSRPTGGRRRGCLRAILHLMQQPGADVYGQEHRVPAAATCDPPTPR